MLLLLQAKHLSPCLWAIAALMACAPNHVVAGEIDFNRDIRPILSNNCFRCHGPDDAHREADLRLDTFAGATAEIASGKAIVPHRPEESVLVSRILSTDRDEQMPPPNSELSLTTRQIELLQQWVKEGAEYQAHWAFQPLQVQAAPTVASPGNSPIDAFVSDQLQHRQLSPSPVAPRGVLLRRLYFDLIGLPPTPEDVQSFLSDARPDAVERVIDRLLASPHYGERWGRHWLDQARYADTNGYTVDSDRSMWPYRDWVIGSLNADISFDQFTVEQLAGDLLDKPTQQQIVATGFHRNTLVNQEGGTDPEQFRNEAVVDRVNTTGAVWLGLTLGCAQCHNHKYDPISHREYYQFFAFFNSDEDVNSVSPTVSMPSAAQATDLAATDAELMLVKNAIQQQEAWAKMFGAQGAQPKAEASTAEQVAADAPAPKQVAAPAAEKSKAERKPVVVSAGGESKADSKSAAAKLEATTQTDPQLEHLQAELKGLEERKKAQQAKIANSMIMRQLAKPRDSFIHIRGDFLRHGEPVAPDVPAAVPPALNKDTSSVNRLALARWLVSPTNPLVSRVAVNRAWSHYFAYGLVETENDFGIQGTTPTHAALLDWLASEFRDRGWSQKRLHRQIVSSSTYQRASTARDDLKAVDANNKFLARQSRLRVEAEIVRDNGLGVSGLLSNQLGGPSIYPPQPDGVYAFTQSKSAWPTSKGSDRYRRGMYTFFRRSAPYPMLTTFDTPRFDTTCTRRLRSNTPLQSLTLANDPAMLEMATALGHRLWECGNDEIDRVNQAFLICFARLPTSEECKNVLAYWNEQRQELQDDVEAAKALLSNLKEQPGWPNMSSDDPEVNGRRAAWIMVARVLMNLDEFVTRE